MTMKNLTKLLALLLALIMLFTACDTGSNNKESGDKKETAASTETVTEPATEDETEPEAESKGNKETEPVTEAPTEPETDAPLSDYRLSISRTRDEIESMITLQSTDFEDAHTLLEEFESIAKTSSNYEEVDATYMEFEDKFYYIDTQISLANIIYDLNRNDTAASSRYLDNYDLFGDLYNAYMESCRNVYLESPIRDELFADWTEEEISQLLNYTPESQELREKNEEILVELNELSGPDAEKRTAELYAQIVTNNNRIAKLAGYDNYYDYATKEVYGRDYTREDIAAFKGYVMKYFVPNFNALSDGWYNKYVNLGRNAQGFMVDFLYEPFDTLDKNYLEGYVNSFDNSTGAGFKSLFENRNMIFASSQNSHQSAYQTYLEDLETPFCLFGSNGQSTSTIVHEMGHYYASLHTPHVTSYDLAETQSQANEYLLLKYLSTQIPLPVYNALSEYNVYNTVAMILICVIIDDFEQRVYSLESVEGYTLEDFEAIMSEVCLPYGGTHYINSKITDINEYWLAVCPNSPVYYISYATSSISALNIFSIADKDEAAGREMYRKLVEETDENDGFKSALAKIGLTDPFTEQTFIAMQDLIVK